MKKINLWLIRQNRKEWKWLEIRHNHPCRDLTKCVNETLYKIAKQREKAKQDHDSTFDLIALFADGRLALDERTLMMECACAIEDSLRKEKGLKLASVTCLDDCDWVRWFTAKDLKDYFKELKKYQRKEEKKHEERDDG